MVLKAAEECNENTSPSQNRWHRRSPPATSLYRFGSRAIRGAVTPDSEAINGGFA